MVIGNGKNETAPLAYRNRRASAEASCPLLFVVRSSFFPWLQDELSLTQVKVEVASLKSRRREASTGAQSRFVACRSVLGGTCVSDSNFACLCHVSS
jgi:hypothetical protein